MSETQIHPQAIVDFVMDNFDDKDYFVRNDKVRINTPFKSTNPKPDEKFHLAIFLIEKNGYPIGNWNCFRSNRSGTFHAFVREIRKCSHQDAWKIMRLYNKKYVNDEILIKKFVSKEKELILPQGVSCVVHPESNKYLHDRNLNNIDILKHNLYFCTEDCRYRNRIIFPFFENEKVVFFSSRKLDNEGDRYLHHYGSKSSFAYNIDNVSLDPLIIVEGVFDAILSNGVALMGNQIFVMAIMSRIRQTVFVYTHL